MGAVVGGVVLIVVVVVICRICAARRVRLQALMMATSSGSHVGYELRQIPGSPFPPPQYGQVWHSHFARFSFYRVRICTRFRVFIRLDDCFRLRVCVFVRIAPVQRGACHSMQGQCRLACCFVNSCAHSHVFACAPVCIGTHAHVCLPAIRPAHLYYA